MTSFQSSQPFLGANNERHTAAEEDDQTHKSLRAKMLHSNASSASRSRRSDSNLASRAKSFSKANSLKVCLLICILAVCCIYAITMLRLSTVSDSISTNAHEESFLDKLRARTIAMRQSAFSGNQVDNKNAEQEAASEAQLRDAIASLSVVSLQSAIQVHQTRMRAKSQQQQEQNAQASQASQTSGASSLFAAAQFMLQHLRDSQDSNKQPDNLNLQKQAPLNPSAIVPSSDPKKIETQESKQKPNATLTSAASGVPLIAATAASAFDPSNYAWWTATPDRLKGLLPSALQAQQPYPIDELPLTTQLRSAAIKSIAGQSYLPSSFPIAVIVKDRASIFDDCLKSLLNTVYGLERSQIVVYQDGTHQGVADVAAKHNVTLVQHQSNEGSPGEEGAARIARHYKFTLSHVFDSHPSASSVLIWEDDMIASPDLLLYFAQTAHLYDVDPSIMCITSYNDNGQHHLSSDPRVLHRTDFLVGLGWLVSHKIYKGEWEQIWPQAHWDHHLRAPAQRKGRQTIYPEVARNHNIGVVGTHSDPRLFKRFFANITLNLQPAVWIGDVQRLQAKQYEEDFRRDLLRALPLTSPHQLQQLTNTVCRVDFSASSSNDPIWERYVAPYFGLWHSVPFIRSAYYGIVRIHLGSNSLFLVPSHSYSWAPKPDNAVTLSSTDFLNGGVRLQEQLTVVTAKQGESCDSACMRQPRQLSPGTQELQQLTCDDLGLWLVNTCEQLNKHFPCVSCAPNQGDDQPAYVSDQKHATAGQCLHSTQPHMSCTGRHDSTQRLCTCH